MCALFVDFSIRGYEPAGVSGAAHQDKSVEGAKGTVMMYDKRVSYLRVCRSCGVDAIEGGFIEHEATTFWGMAWHGMAHVYLLGSTGS